MGSLLLLSTFFSNCKIRRAIRSATRHRRDEICSQKRRVTTTFSRDFFIIFRAFKAAQTMAQVSNVHSERNGWTNQKVVVVENKGNPQNEV